ncbi:MAG: hypothetical protein WEB89_02940 [Balneolales bacterium]
MNINATEGISIVMRCFPEIAAPVGLLNLAGAEDVSVISVTNMTGAAAGT